MTITATIPPPSDLSSAKPRVMLVDDNETDNLITRRVVQLSGFADEVLVCNSGKAALEFLAENSRNPELLPDIIFLDINMPIVDGFIFLYEIEQWIDQLARQPRIIILSSSDSRQDIDRLQGHSLVTRYMTKPLNTEALHELKATL